MKKFKKIIIGSLCVVLFSSSVVLAATGKVTGKTVRIRESADSSSKIVTNAYRNDDIKVIGEEGEWYQVEYEGKTGYISKEFVEVKEYNPTNTETTETTTPTTTNNEQPVESTTSTPTIIKDSNLKLLPAFSSRTLGTIPTGTEVEVKREVTNWLQITAGSNTGWILKNNVTGYAKTTAAQPVQEETVEVQEPEETVAETDNNEGDYNSQTGYINTDTVRIRETAGGKIIGNLDINDVVTIIGEDGDWYHISCDKFNDGYVSKSLVTIGKVPSRSLTEERGSEVVEEIQEEQTIVENVQEQEVEEEAEPEPEPEPEPEYSYSAPASSGEGSDIAEFAQQFVGCPYVYGGTSPDGFDCSGFAQYVYSNFGYDIARVSSSQAQYGEEVAREDMEPGDLILFQDSGRSRIGHSAIYIGDGNFVHAANPSAGVRIDNIDTSSYYDTRFVTARRID